MTAARETIWDGESWNAPPVAVRPHDPGEHGRQVDCNTAHHHGHQHPVLYLNGAWLRCASWANLARRPVVLVLVRAGPTREAGCENRRTNCIAGVTRERRSAPEPPVEL